VSDAVVSVPDIARQASACEIANCEKRVPSFHIASEDTILGSSRLDVLNFLRGFSDLLARSERFELPTLRFEV
jgi:hypothetical protein